MTSCPCPPASLTSVCFAEGVVLVRCSAHEQQSWFVDGQEVARTEALTALKDLVVARRGERRTAATSRRPKVIRMQEPVAYDVPAEADDAERLTALLRARGLSGTWAVA